MDHSEPINIDTDLEGCRFPRTGTDTTQVPFIALSSGLPTHTQMYLLARSYAFTRTLRLVSIGLPGAHTSGAFPHLVRHADLLNLKPTLISNLHLKLNRSAIDEFSVFKKNVLLEFYPGAGELTELSDDKKVPSQSSSFGTRLLQEFEARVRRKKVVRMEDGFCCYF